jgi:hypothetical protein
MLNRTMTASVLPRSGRWRAAVPSLRQVRLRLTASRERSLVMQERVDRARARCNERHGYGRQS